MREQVQGNICQAQDVQKEPRGLNGQEGKEGHITE